MPLLSREILWCARDRLAIPRQNDQGQGRRADTGREDRRIPSEGEHKTMKIAGDCGTHNQTLGYLLSSVAVLALVAMSSGCAGLSSVGDNRTGLSVHSGTAPTKQRNRQAMTFTPTREPWLVLRCPRRYRLRPRIPARIPRKNARTRNRRTGTRPGCPGGYGPVKGERRATKTDKNRRYQHPRHAGTPREFAHFE